jgi:glutathione S-transferase
MAAIGHGERTDIDPSVALAAARAAEPAPAARTSHPQEGDPRPGEQVSFVDSQEIALLRHDSDVGWVAVHFPRLGYDWRRA